MNISKMLNAPQRAVYRIALFGVSGAGKTAILAALAMARWPHPKGYTCNWLPLDFAIPTNLDELPAGRKRNLARGRQWLEEAIDHLKRADVPKGTSESAGHMLFDFEFNNPARNQSFKVELIDYAGELINPRQTTNENAKHLRAILKNMDALLLLAPAPAPEGDGETARLNEDIHKLRETFALVRGERQTGAALELPIALLVNKWDRYSSWEGQPDQKTEDAKLKTFLASNPPPPHQGLYDAIKGSVVSGCIAAFPVSAFGPHERVQTEDGRQIERPKNLNPLQSFGLEDAFIWALEKHDAISLQRLEQDSGKVGHGLPVWLNKALFPWPLPTWRVWQQAARLAEQLPKQSAEQHTVTRLLTRNRNLTAIRSASLVVLVSLAALVMEFVQDGWRYRSLQTAFSDPSATPADLSNGEQWLENYYESAFYRHRLAKLLIISSRNAKQELDRLRDERQEVLWRAINTLTDPEERLKVAGEYRSRYPNGGHLNDILKIQEEVKRDQDERAWKQVRDNRGEAQLTAAQAYLDKHPTGLHVGDARTLIAEAEAQKAWGEFAAGVEEQVASGKLDQLLQAATSLNAYRKPLGAAEQAAKSRLENEIARRAWPLLEAEVAKASDLKAAEEMVARYQASWPSHMRDGDWRGLTARISETQDKALYAAVQKGRSQEACTEYLNQAPLGTMQSSVQAYLDYLNKNQAAIDLILKLETIQVGTRVGRTYGLFPDKYRYSVSFNGQELTSGDFSASDGKPVTVNIERAFKAKLNDSVELSAILIDPGSQRDTRYSQKEYVRVSTLLTQGYTLDIGGGHAFMFTLAGSAPEEPALPTWGRN